ncbi:MAG: hypothetical protein GEU90_09025 [Gemmatimonas sp.]|nr:hypothetical protein [Gemmatimonas sp.]
MHRSLVRCLLACLLAAACATAPPAPLEPDLMGPRPPRSIDEIELIEGDPERPYAVLGVWEAVVESAYGKDANDFRDRMVAQAAQLGADGVVFAVVEEDAGDADATLGGLQAAETKVLAAIIVWVERQQVPTTRGVA